MFDKVVVTSKIGKFTLRFDCIFNTLTPVFDIDQNLVKLLIRVYVLLFRLFIVLSCVIILGLLYIAFYQKKRKKTTQPSHTATIFKQACPATSYYIGHLNYFSMLFADDTK